jgi:hypothetical protein
MRLRQLNSLLITEAKHKIPRRILGNTGYNATIIGLGGESTLKVLHRHVEAIEIIHTALDLGINYIDTAPSYTAPAYGDGVSEQRIGEVIADGRRSEFYLATKCDQRSNEAAWRQINESIERLGDTPDCIQIHHLDEISEVDKVFAKDGAIVALKKAQEQKLCTFLGITGHSDPMVLLEALHRYKFDTVLGALNVADLYSYSFQTRLLPYCFEHDVGFIAMKVCARGRIFKKGGISSMRECLDYVWSVPGVCTAIVGTSTVEQLRHNRSLAVGHKKLSLTEMHKLEKLVEPNTKQALFFRKGFEWLDNPEVLRQDVR